MTMQEFWDAYKVPLTSAITWVVLFVGTLLARYKLSPNAWYAQFLRVLFGAIVDSVHPSTFVQVAAQSKAAKKESKMKKKAVVQGLLCFLMLPLTLLLATGCGGGLQKQLNAVLVAEQQAQNYEEVLAKMVTDAIAALPADQQAAALAKFTDIKSKLDIALSNKETALMDAIVADSTAGLNIGQLIGDVTTLIGSLVDLVTVLAPAKSVEAKNIGAQMISMHTKVKLVQQ